MTAEQALSQIIPIEAQQNKSAKDIKHSNSSKSKSLDPPLGKSSADVSTKSDQTNNSLSQQMRMPNIPEFEEMISKYTNIERLVTEMPSAQRFSFIAMDCEPIKNALRNATGRWTLTFTQYLSNILKRL